MQRNRSQLSVNKRWGVTAGKPPRYYNTKQYARADAEKICRIESKKYHAKNDHPDRAAIEKGEANLKKVRFVIMDKTEY